MNELLGEDHSLESHKQVKWFVTEEGDIAIQGVEEGYELILTATDLAGMSAGLAQLESRG